MKTVSKIDIKRQELNRLRHSIARTMGPPKARHGAGYGLVAVGFIAGVVVERLGWRPMANSALSANYWLTLASQFAAPVMAFMATESVTGSQPSATPDFLH